MPQRRVRPARAARGAHRPAGSARSGWCRSRRPRASPFAQSLLFGWIAVYMYEGDAPLAERRAAALALDRDLLRDLLGAEELRELIDPVVLGDLELELQRLADGRRARDADEAARPAAPARPAVALGARRPLRDGHRRRLVERWVEPLVAERRAIRVVDRRRGAHRRGRGRRPAARRARRGAAGRPAGRVHRLGARAARRPRRPLRPHPRPVRHRPGGASATALGRRPGAAGARSARAARAASSGASSGPTASSASGATTTCCASCGGGRWPRCAREVEPVDAAALARFLPRVAGRRRAPGGASTRWSRPSARCRARRCRRRCSRPTCCRPGSPATARPTSTRCAPPARWCGSAPVRSAPPTVGSACCSATRPGCWSPLTPLADDGRRVDATAAADRRQPDPRYAAARRAHRTVQRGASFWPELVAAAPAAGRALRRRVGARRAVGPGVGRRGHQRLARARCGPWWPASLARAAAHGPVDRCARAPGGPTSGVRTSGACRRSGPPAAAGRWSLVAPLLRPAPQPTEAAHAQALQLLERHGVLTREAALAEGIEGGFAGVYPVLKALEERGQVRRGYFVAGLGAAQFALPGAVDRLRRPAIRSSPTSRRWCCRPPIRPSRTAPRCRGPRPRVVRRAAPGPSWCWSAGEPVAELERGGKSLSTFAAAARPPALGRGADLAGQGRSAAQARDRQDRRRPRRRVARRRSTAPGRLRRRLQGTALPHLSDSSLTSWARCADADRGVRRSSDG